MVAMRAKRAKRAAPLKKRMVILIGCVSSEFVRGGYGEYSLLVVLYLVRFFSFLSVAAWSFWFC